MEEAKEKEELRDQDDPNTGPMSYIYFPVPGEPQAYDGEERSDTRLRSLGIDPDDDIFSILAQLDRISENRTLQGVDAQELAEEDKIGD